MRVTTMRAMICLTCLSWLEPLESSALKWHLMNWKNT